MSNYDNRNSQGTITLVQGNVNVVGIGTNFLTDGVLKGDMFVHDATQTVSFIDSVVDDNHLSFDKPWMLGGGSAQTFTIYRLEQLVRLGTTHKILLDVLSVLESFSGVLTATSGLPNSADGVDGDLKLDPATATFYSKDNGVWSSGAAVVGLPGADGADGADGVNGADGDDGADGEYTTNVDGGHPDSVYGGVPIIDGGVI